MLADPSRRSIVTCLAELQPDRASGLAAILNRRCALRVAAAVDGDRLAPAQLCVYPPGQHTLITGNMSLALIPSGALPPYWPPADLLLTPLAVAAGPRAIAVVLTGRGNDAATGASAVHRFGGTIIASILASSTQRSMTQATINATTPSITSSPSKTSPICSTL